MSMAVLLNCMQNSELPWGRSLCFLNPEGKRLKERLSSRALQFALRAGEHHALLRSKPSLYSAVHQEVLLGIKAH